MAAAAAAADMEFGGIALTAPHAVCPSWGCDESAAVAAAALESTLREHARTRNRLYVAPAAQRMPRSVCDNNRDAARQLRGPDACRPRTVADGSPSYGLAQIDYAAELTALSGGASAALLLDVHSFDVGTPRTAPCLHCVAWAQLDDRARAAGDPRYTCERWADRSQCRVGWDTYPLMIGVDATNEASVRAGRALRHHLLSVLRPALRAQLWDVSADVNYLIAEARRRGGGGGRGGGGTAVRYASLLLEFNDGIERARTLAYATAVGDWVAANTLRGAVTRETTLHMRSRVSGGGASAAAASAALARVDGLLDNMWRSSSA